IQLEGVNLGSVASLRVRAGADTAVGTRLPVAFVSARGTALCDRQLMVGEYREVFPTPPVDTEQPGYSGTLPVPGTANGRVSSPSGDLWRITARRHQPLCLEVHAQRLGSPLDAVLEVLDELGRPVPRATLRCVARAYTDMDMEGNFDSESTLLGVTDWAPF